MGSPGLRSGTFEVVNRNCPRRSLRGQSKALPGDGYGLALETFEKAKACLRTKVEHPFNVAKNLFKHLKTRYRGLPKNAAQLFSLFGLANLMLARRGQPACDAQGAP